MATDTKPVYGSMQPAIGYIYQVSSLAMPRGAKTRKVPTLIRAVVAANIGSRMDLRYADSTNRPKALAEDAKVSLSTVQRILGAQIGASVDTLETIANALECSVLELFVPTNELIRSLGVSKAQATTLIPSEWRRAQ